MSFSTYPRLETTERYIRLLTLEAEIRLAARDRQHRLNAILVSADGTATLPHDWQACVTPYRHQAHAKRMLRAACDYPTNPVLAGEWETN